MAANVLARDRLLRLAPALVGLALLALFFAPTLDPSVQLYYRDTGRLYYPVKLFIAQQLRAGHLPLWDPMTECGVSLLGQLTPGLLHPATLLYLLPFDLAFKLNHILGPLLAGIGVFRLARRLRASAWASLAGAIAYAGCGYVISVTGSNLPYAVGAGSVPIAIDAVIGCVEAPSAGRLGWGGAAVALIAYAGEPQAMLIAGLLSGAWALFLAFPDPRRALRNLGMVAGCGAVAIAFSAPAVFPAAVELRRSSRAGPLTDRERATFANHPLRLAGLLVPRAFDDAPEVLEDGRSVSSPYTEYFTEGSAAFADSIVLGAPALLLALAGAFAGRRGALLFAGGSLLALASTGTALGIDRVLFAAVPLAGIFRFAEKLTAPASLLLALAAALGADLALSGTRRAAFRLAAAALALAAVTAAFALYVGANADRLAAALTAFGKTHRLLFAEAFWRETRAGLLDCAGLCAVLAAVGLWRWRRQLPAAGLGAVCCAASVFASCGGLLYSVPLEVVRGPFDLAERLYARAGPSPGRWRLFVNDRDPLRLGGLTPRASVTMSMAQALLPQFNAVAGIEGMSAYFSASDPGYVRGIRETPETYFNLFGVRFAVEMPDAFTPREARLRNFHKVGFGYWVREYPVLPRAFVVGRARRAGSLDEALAQVAAPGFDVRQQAVVRGDVPSDVQGTPSSAELERQSPERIAVRAKGPGLLVVGEHFDPGWRATVGGAREAVAEVDLAALGVVLPASATSVVLTFVPLGLRPGLALALGVAAALAATSRWRRRWVAKGLTNPVTAGQILSLPGPAPAAKLAKEDVFLRGLRLALTSPRRLPNGESK